MGYATPRTTPTVIQTARGLVDGRPLGVFTVTEFGAVGDGATDDATAIQAAIDAANGSGVVLVPPGTFLIGSALLLPTGTTFVGSGRNATTLKLAASANVNMIEAEAGGVSVESDIRVAHMALDGNKANQNGGADKWGVFLQRCERVVVEDLDVHDVDGVGVEVRGTEEKRVARVSNILVRDNASHGIQVSNGMRDVIWNNIQAVNNGGAGIVVDHSESIADNLLARGNGNHGIIIRNITNCVLTNLSAFENYYNGINVIGLVLSYGANWVAGNNNTSGSAPENTTIGHDIFFDDLATFSYGATRDTTLNCVKTTSMFDAATASKYGLYMEDGTNVNMRLFNLDIAQGTVGTIRFPSTAGSLVATDAVTGSATFRLIKGSLKVQGTLGPITKPSVAGSTGGNAALESLLSTLAALGLITDSTT